MIDDDSTLLSVSATLIMKKLTEIEDCSTAHILEKALCMYAYIHEQIAENNRLFVVNKNMVVQTEIIFKKAEEDKDAWFNQFEGF